MEIRSCMLAAARYRYQVLGVLAAHARQRKQSTIHNVVGSDVTASGASEFLVPVCSFSHAQILEIKNLSSRSNTSAGEVLQVSDMILISTGNCFGTTALILRYSDC